jgi:malonyl-CoA/methylmalonyl-CoA synthetase
VLLPALAAPSSAPALEVTGRALDYAQLRGAAGALAARLHGAERVAVWAEPTLETCVAVVAGLLAGVPVVPVNPRSGERELEHIVRDSAPSLVLAAPGETLPGGFAGTPRLDVDVTARDGGALRDEPDGEAPALVVYTSGTTGPPKGAVLPRRAIAANLDGLADAWAWTAADRLVHGLPLFHVHGLVLGLLGPLRRGGALEHLGRFSPAAAADALERGGTMLFGVPTMYHRLAAEAESDPRIAAALGSARLLVSGSAALPAAEHERLRRLTGQRVVERYGMTETLITTSTRADGERRAGSVGTPLRAVALRLLDDDGAEIAGADGTTIGEIAISGDQLFLGYLNRPDATAQAMRDGWFVTGDLAIRDPDGSLRVVGRRATDLIKSGGFKIGAGEIEGALLEHPAVAEAAVAARPDPDLGERIVAWVVAEPGAAVGAAELADHVAALLSPHKRPREVRFLDALPRNELGKVRKAALPDPPG